MGLSADCTRFNLKSHLDCLYCIKDRLSALLAYPAFFFNEPKPIFKKMTDVRLNTYRIPSQEGVYIVGGSIRDLWRGHPPVDIDITVARNPETFARTLAQKLSGRVVHIGKPEHAILRVITARHIYDVSPLVGDGIDADLANRDFTINAMAYDVSSERIIDPFDGRGDLTRRIVRMLRATAFQKDPLRLIRAYRMGSDLNFRIEKRTRAAIRTNARHIGRVAGERIRAELFKIFAGRHSHPYLSAMAEDDVLFEILPELRATRGCAQNLYHPFDVWQHTLHAYAQLENNLNHLPDLFIDTIKPLTAALDRTPPAILKSAVLMHDIGKPLLKTVASRGAVHFYGHAARSAAMAMEIAARLKFSNQEKGLLKAIIRNHLRPFFLMQAHRYQSLSRKAVTRFFMHCGDATPAILLHALADHQGKFADDAKVDQSFREFVQMLMKSFYIEFKPRKSKRPLLNGNDLMHIFGLAPAPLFKEILRLVETARIAHMINSRAEAIDWVRHFLQARKNKT